MQIAVNGTRLSFDVEGPALVPHRSSMRERPTVILIHGGPASYDHSYFKPHFSRLADVAQVVYLDLRDHGRSARHDPEDWSFETCADDVRAFCDVLSIDRPLVLGHSMGGFIAMLYGARHPGHAGGLILVSTNARFDLDRLVGGFRRAGGDDVAELAGRDYGGEPVTDAEWARVFEAFGPNRPTAEELARRVRNPALAPRGMELLRRFDIVDRLDQSPARRSSASANSIRSLPSTHHAKSSLGSLPGSRPSRSSRAPATSPGSTCRTASGRS